MTGFVNNISIASLPALSHLSGSDDLDRIKRLFAETMLIIIWITGFIIGGFLLFNGALVSLWAGKAHYFGETNNVFSCFSFYFLSITYGISTILYCFGDIKKNNVVAIFRNVFYLIVVIFLVKRYGITGEIVAFLFSIIAINCSFYPYRLIKLAKFNYAEKRLLIKELLLSLLILTMCSVVGYFLPIKSSWPQLIIFCIIYSFIFFGYYLIVPSDFKAILLSKLNLRKVKTQV